MASSAADNEVLLDLPLAWPRNDAAPGGDVILRNHSSISFCASSAEMTPRPKFLLQNDLNMADCLA